MPRPKKEGAAPPKTRSRHGCCGEEKPSCLNCQRQGETCDYSIRLNWDGRNKRRDDDRPGAQPMIFAHVASVPKQFAQKTSLRGDNEHGRSAISQTRPSTSSASEFPTQSDSSGFQPPFGQLDDRRELLPPFSAGPSSTRRPRPLSLGSPYSQPQELSSGFMEVDRNMAQSSQAQPVDRMNAYPSPKDSAFDTPKRGLPAPASSTISKGGPRSYWLPNSTLHTEYDASPERSAKRMRLSAMDDLHQNLENSRPHRASSYGPGDVDEPYQPSSQPPTPNTVSSHANNPMTPASSSTNSEEMHQTLRLASNQDALQDREVRRVSVNSLLSGSPELERNRKMASNHAQAYSDLGAVSPFLAYSSPSRKRANSSTQMESYGLDRGLPDLDVPRNNDAAAINGISPAQQIELDAWLDSFDLRTTEFGFGLQKREFVFAKGGYYASPVPIKIPKKLEPLPSTLLENPMNLLYFHHFLNHTAKILVVHDCSQNPFRTLLPQMAIDNPNLLNLLLAYSASHRARLLTQPEPALRIAHWVQDVFPSLRHALDDAESSNVEVSDANLATAIMLTSLEIISPSAFGVSVSWQNHLNIARRIIRYRGIFLQPVSRKNAVPHFLHLWLAYIDVLGSLSSRTLEEPLFYATLEDLSHDGASILLNDDDYIIECMLGFTSHCVPILAQIANLARLCSNARDNAAIGRTEHDWPPSAEIQLEFERLQAELERSRLHPVKHCPHYGHVDDLTGRNAIASADDVIAVQESGATNDAFHRAALIHLLRRVRLLPRSAPDVQHAVQEIVGALSKVRRGGSAEACLLFPMFTAGAEAEDAQTRMLILERVKSLEGVGMMQVGRARVLMEKVWETGEEWETLAQGEFFG